MSPNGSAKLVFSDRVPNTLSLVKQTESPALKSCHWCCYGAQTEQCFNSTTVFTLCRESTFEWLTYIFHHLISPLSRTALFEHIKPLPNFTWYSQHDVLMDCVLCFARWKHTIALYSKNGKHMLLLSEKQSNISHRMSQTLIVYALKNNLICMFLRNHRWLLVLGKSTFVEEQMCESDWQIQTYISAA